MVPVSDCFSGLKFQRICWLTYDVVFDIINNTWYHCIIHKYCASCCFHAFLNHALICKTVTIHIVEFQELWILLSVHCATQEHLRLPQVHSIWLKRTKSVNLCACWDILPSRYSGILYFNYFNLCFDYFNFHIQALLQSAAAGSA